MKRVTIQTLGCKLNQFESDSLATKFRQAGYRLVDPGGLADAHIINTCTVTGKADRKSRNLIYQAQRYAREYERRLGTGALVVVTGCFAEGNADEIAALENVYVVGNGRKSAIFEIVDAHLRGEIADGTEALTSQQQPLSPGETAETQETASENLFRYVTPERLFHTRGMLKIQDGCDNYCTFCIIPYVRGKAASRPAEGVLAGMRRMVDMGYREIVLTGVNMSRYRDGECNFSTLLEQLLECDGDFRLRISSLEPDQLDERFFALLQHPKMAAHLHLCLQSGSERILLQMRRQYTAAQYRTMADRIRTVNPLFNITTDIIVGFPDESGHDFDASCDFVRDYTMGHVHVFPYAVRRGTRAARMSRAVSASVLKERAGSTAHTGRRVHQTVPGAAVRANPAGFNRREQQEQRPRVPRVLRILRPG